MRKYIDCIRVSNIDLAYTIVEALEKDDKYSVDFFENDSSRRRDNGYCEIELRVFNNEKIVPASTVGLVKEN